MQRDVRAHPVLHLGQEQNETVNGRTNGASASWITAPGNLIGLKKVREARGHKRHDTYESTRDHS